MYFGYEIRHFQCLSCIFKPSTYQQTSPVEPTSDCQVSPWVRLLRSWPNASSRISLEVSTAVIDATPGGQWGWVRRGDWKQGLFERGRPQVHQPGEGCEDESMMWTRLKTDIWRVYACLPSGKIMSNFGPVHLLNGADSQPKSCCLERIEGLPREIVQAQPLFNFPSLVLTCCFLSAFKNWVICCSRLHVCSHQTLDQTSILGYIPWELGEWGLPFSISIEVPLKTFDDEKWDPFPSRTCQKTKWHLSFAKDDLNHGKYYIHRVHLDFTAAVFLAAVWLWQHFSAREDSSSNTRVFFGFLGIKIKLSLGAWRLYYWATMVYQCWNHKPILSWKACPKTCVRN